ncbi:MAG TPA: hypothetical protein VIG97_02395 [Luteimonas sp.]
MIYFPALRTKRLRVQLRELTIGESLQLAAMPPDRPEAVCTAFLRFAAADTDGVADPLQWTVPERMLACCQYMAATLEDGPDFPVGPARYSDYLNGERDIGDELVPVGEVGGDVWLARHLTGGMTESIERLAGELSVVSGRLHWLYGAMAAQLVREGESVPSPEDGEGAFDEWLVKRMTALLAYPDSDAELLMGHFLHTRDRMQHLFHIDFGNDGIIAMPKGGVANLPPARFPADSCVSKFAREMGGKPD